jgi:hypothetical protein
MEHLSVLATSVLSPLFVRLLTLLPLKGSNEGHP